jgi:hypothetical protein
MERAVRRFRSFEEAEAADDAYYASLTPQARVELLLDLIRAHQEATGEAAQGLARVCRVTQLGEG